MTDTMTIESVALEDLALDWVVTAILKPDELRYGVDDWRERRRRETVNGEFVFRWSQSWAQSGSLIEDEGLVVGASPFVGSRFIAGEGAVGDPLESLRHVATGPTPLVAAMRSLVLKHRGHHVDIPMELAPEPLVSALRQIRAAKP